jgi:hypothetical protein
MTEAAQNEYLKLLEECFHIEVKPIKQHKQCTPEQFLHGPCRCCCRNRAINKLCELLEENNRMYERMKALEREKAAGLALRMCRISWRRY